MTPASLPDQRARSDRSSWFVLLLLLPTGLLTLPSVLAGDPLPHASATGWTLLAALPAIAALPFVVRPGILKSALWFLPLALLAGVALIGDAATDVFELRRAVLLLTLSIAFFTAGSSLSAHSVRFYQRGAILLSLAFTAQALFDRFTDGPLGAAGSLGNTGVLSQAALPGAVLGALHIGVGPLPFRLLGGLAAIAFGLHAGSTPVLAGALAFGLALIAAALLAPTEERVRRWRTTAFAAIAPLTLLAAPLFHTPAETASPEQLASVDAPVQSDTGGAEVRLRIWSRLPALIADHPLTGVGPGQFRAQFPPYRDPLEIELSTHRRTLAIGSEVEHAHADALQVLAEYGLPGGLCFAALLVLIAKGSLRAVRSSDSSRSALGATCLALLANAMVHSPLSFEPVPALLAWVLFGALLLHGQTIGGQFRAGTWLAALLALCLFALAPRASSFVRHGALLTEHQTRAAKYSLSGPSASTKRGVDADFWLKEGHILRELLEVAPDSALAHSLSAVHFGSWDPTGSTHERSEAAWSRTLELRPHQVSALIGLGTLAGDTPGRRAFWERALKIDPGHPVALRNLTRLEWLEGDPDRAMTHLETLRAADRADDEFQLDLAARALLAGRTQAGIALLSHLEPNSIAPRADDLFAMALEDKQLAGDTLLSDALTCGAHRLWGIEHLQAGDMGFAIAKFRQALRVTRKYLSGGDAPTRLLLAATLELEGREEEARAELQLVQNSTLHSRDWVELPELVRSALIRLGYEPPEPRTE